MEWLRLPSNWLGYMATEGMDAVSFFALAPFLFPMVVHVTDDHHTSSAIVNYGILLAMIALGRVIGRDIFKNNDHADQLLAYSLLMTILLLLAAFCSNFSVFVVIFLFKEAVGSIISRVYVGIHSSTRIMPDRGISALSPSVQQTFSSDNIMRRNLIAFVFAALITSLLFDESTHVRFPAYFPCIFLALIWNVLIFIYQLGMVKASLFSSPFGDSKRVINIKRNQRQSQKSRLRGDTSNPPPELTAIKDQDIPNNFIEFCSGNIAKAKDMYHKSLQWRYDYDVDSLLTTPQKHFQEIIEGYPHAIHGRSRDGCVVLYELLGKAKMSRLQGQGVTVDDIIWHFNLRNEFVFQKLFLPSQDLESNTPAPASYGFLSRGKAPVAPAAAVKPVFGQIMTVIDVKGISMSDFNSDVISFIKQSSEIIDGYYPGRVKRLVICNAPSWFSTVWGMVARVLPETVKQKINIIASPERLDEFIAPSQRPVEYGGTDVPLGSSPDHQNFLKLAEGWEATSSDPGMANGVEMTSISNTKKSFNSLAPSEGEGKWSLRKLGSFFSRDKSGKARKKSSGPSKAFLGLKNNYRYDEISKSWQLDLDPITGGSEGESDSHEDSDSESDHPSDDDDISDEEELLKRRKRRDRKEKRQLKEVVSSTGLDSQLEEHALLLAIQAAHSNHSTAPGGVTEADDSSSSSSSSGQGKLSPEIFMLSMGMYTLSSLMYIMLLTLIPVWMLLKPVVGGLGYTSIDVGLVASGTALVLLLIDTYSRERYSFVMKSSPLRMIRITSGLLCATLLLVPIFLTVTVPPGMMAVESQSLESPIMIAANQAASINTQVKPMIVKKQPMPEESLQAAAAANVAAVVKPKKKSKKVDVNSALDDGVFGGGGNRRRLQEVDPHIADQQSARGGQLQHSGGDIYEPPKGSIAHSFFSTFFKQAVTEFHHFNLQTPRESILYLPQPSIIIAMLICGAYVSRKASAILLQVALAPAVTDSHSLVRGISGAVDVIIPPVVCVVYRIVYEHTLHHQDKHGYILPSALNVSSFFSVALCISSLLYCFTLLLNIQFRGDFGVMPDHIDNNVPSGLSDSHSNSSRSTAAAHHHSSSASVPSSGIGEIISVMQDDIRLLRSTPKFSYGSKLYNLKVDMKDL